MILWGGLDPGASDPPHEISYICTERYVEYFLKSGYQEVNIHDHPYVPMYQYIHTNIP